MSKKKRPATAEQLLDLANRDSDRLVYVPYYDAEGKLRFAVGDKGDLTAPVVQESRVVLMSLFGDRNNPYPVAVDLEHPNEDLDVLERLQKMDQKHRDRRTSRHLGVFLTAVGGFSFFVSVVVLPLLGTAMGWGTPNLWVAIIGEILLVIVGVSAFLGKKGRQALLQQVIDATRKMPKGTAATE